MDKKENKPQASSPSYGELKKLYESSKKANAALRGLNQKLKKDADNAYFAYTDIKRKLNERNELIDALNKELQNKESEIQELKNKNTTPWWKRLFA
jgi:predicted RNase H-like nuclease (RuvC/YqgF family)